MEILQNLPEIHSLWQLWQVNQDWREKIPQYLYPMFDEVPKRTRQSQPNLHKAALFMYAPRMFGRLVRVSHNWQLDYFIIRQGWLMMKILLWPVMCDCNAWLSLCYNNMLIMKYLYSSNEMSHMRPKWCFHTWREILCFCFFEYTQKWVLDPNFCFRICVQLHKYI